MLCLFIQIRRFDHSPGSLAVALNEHGVHLSSDYFAEIFERQFSVRRLKIKDNSFSADYLPTSVRQMLVFIRP